jgi:hypothetical protein
MVHLVAFTGTRSGGLHKVLATNNTIFETQDFTSRVAYSPATNLDTGEWFYIGDFIAKNYENDFINRSSPINTTSLNQAPVDKYKSIKYLCCEIGTDKYFQKFLPSQLLSKKWFSVSDSPVLEVDKKIISFSNIPDAVYDSASDTLYFRDIAKVKTIFKGIGELYREATQREVKEFLEQDFIVLTDGYSIDDVKVPNRKRIASAVDRLTSYSVQDKSDIFNYIHEYCPTVIFNNGKFSISSEDDLKYVLFGIDERYYTTKLGNEKRLANSVISMT